MSLRPGARLGPLPSSSCGQFLRARGLHSWPLSWRLSTPSSFAKTLLPVPGYITKGFKALPPLTPLPAVAGLIVILNVVGYLSYYLDWIVLFVWMGLSMFFSADLTIGVWKKEQRTTKEGSEDDKPLISPGGSLHTE